MAANALVRCCFHSYADNEYVKQMDERESPYAQINNQRNEQQKTNKDQVDGVKYTSSNWGDVTDLTDSDNTASTQPTQKLNSIQNHHSINASTKSAKKSLNDSTNKTKKQGKTNGFTNGNPTELNSDDTEIMTTNSSISQNSPVEEDVALIHNSYKTMWSTSKSLSGSVKNLNLSSKEAARIAKGASMRSLRPRQMVMPNMLGAPISFVPIHAMPHPQLIPHPQLDGKSSKSTNKLLKKMKSKSMITLVPQPTSIQTPIPPHAIPIGQIPPQFLTNGKHPHQQMMFINHPQGIYGHLPPMIPTTPQPITGNIHSIKKKSKKNKEKQLLQQQLSELQFLGQHQGQPILIPPMRPLTPLTNYLDSNQKYLIQTIGPQNTTSIYHTAPRNRKELEKLNKKLNKKGDKLSAINADELQAMINNQNNLNNYHNKQSNKQQSNSNSPFNTGLYRKKGHLMNINERAFSYSIRQEHRSRSNSVANLNFNQDEVDHLQSANYLPSDHPQEQLQNQMANNKARKLSQNGSAILNNSNSSQSSSQALSKQQQLARQHQQQQQQQQYYLHQQQSLTDALNNLQINGQLNQPKTASIKRSKLNNNNMLFHNGQMNGNAKHQNGYETSANQMMPTVPPVFNGKFVLPTQNV